MVPPDAVVVGGVARLKGRGDDEPPATATRGAWFPAAGVPGELAKSLSGASSASSNTDTLT